MCQTAVKRVKLDIGSWEQLKKMPSDLSIDGEKTTIALSEKHQKQRKAGNSIKVNISPEIIIELHELFQTSTELLRHFWGNLESNDAERVVKCQKLIAALEQNLNQVRMLQQAAPNQANDIQQVF